MKKGKQFVLHFDPSFCVPTLTTKNVNVRVLERHGFWLIWFEGLGIFGIRDLTKIWCGNRENDKYIDGIRDLTVPREPGLAKNWALDAGFMFACLSGMPEAVTTHRF